MKTLCVVLVSLVIGGAVGWGATWAEFRKPPIVGAEPQEEVPASVAPVGISTLRQSGQPVALYVPVYNFGFMEVGTENHYDFSITNDGDAPLEITFLRTSCQCTVGKLKKGKGDRMTIAPHETEEVTLTWTPKVVLGEFRQRALLESNDPQHRQIILTVEGQVTQTVVVSPTELVFSSLSPSQPVSGELRVYCFRDEPIRIVGHHLEDASTAHCFEVSYHPLEGEKFPMAGAKSAWEVKVDLKPGLPLGPIQQRIVLETNLEVAKSLVVPVYGNVTSDLKVVGKGWQPEQGVLKIGTVASGEGAKRTLFLLAPQPDFAVAVEKVESESLRVTVGQAAQVNNGAVTRVPVEIDIPPGSEPADYLGGSAGPFAEVLLKTNHQDAEHVRVRVQFAVQR